ncbi:TrkA family potassium uptake protein [bacterium]|nr:TrkA family potassium uptake protein [bacterium]
MEKQTLPRTFLVAGLGRFGSQVAQQLAGQGAVVLAVDIDADKVEEIKDYVPRAVCLDAADSEAMAAVGAFDLDVAIIAFPGRFDKSVLVTHALRKHHMKRIIVRVTTSEEAEAILAIGATEVVFPERDVAHSIADQLLYPDLAGQVPLSDDFSVLEIPCPPQLVGKTLEELHLRRKHGVTLIAIKCQPDDPLGQAHVRAAPDPDEPLEADCHLLLLGARKRLRWFKSKMFKEE